MNAKQSLLMSIFLVGSLMTNHSKAEVMPDLAKGLALGLAGRLVANVAYHGLQAGPLTSLGGGGLAMVVAAPQINAHLNPATAFGTLFTCLASTRDSHGDTSSQELAVSLLTPLTFLAVLAIQRAAS